VAELSNDLDEKRIMKKGWLRSDSGQGFTLVELLVAITIIGTLTAIAIPQFNGYRAQQKVNLAINDLRTIDNKIQSYKLSNEVYPLALTDVPRLVNLIDPWGITYEYLKIEGADTPSKGKMRKDKNLVPINSDFDLYSMGADTKSATPLTSKNSQDDVVRANDGRYYGLASTY
jgi:general secretion pathway protein G